MDMEDDELPVQGGVAEDAEKVGNPTGQMLEGDGRKGSRNSPDHVALKKRCILIMAGPGTPEALECRGLLKLI